MNQSYSWDNNPDDLDELLRKLQQQQRHASALRFGNTAQSRQSPMMGPPPVMPADYGGGNMPPQYRANGQLNVPRYDPARPAPIQNQPAMNPYAGRYDARYAQRHDGMNRDQYQTFNQNRINQMRLNHEAEFGSGVMSRDAFWGNGQNSYTSPRTPGGVPTTLPNTNFPGAAAGQRTAFPNLSNTLGNNPNRSGNILFGGGG